MQPFETVPPDKVWVETSTVACAGDGGVGGHPKVYLNLGPDGQVECPYCSRLFVRGKAEPTRMPPNQTRS